MKKLLCFVLAAVLLLASAVALAETKTINPQEKRGIKLHKVGLNEVEEGISPTTGLTLSQLDVPDPETFTGLAVTGRYLPMMVQIGNDSGGVDRNAAWGVAYADIVYEAPLHKNGTTRLTVLFSDLIPDSVGPVRSARLGHLWIREEWKAGFLFYGQQEYKQTNVLEEIKKLGYKSYLSEGFFSGMVGDAKPWKKYYVRRTGKGFSSPNNVDANVAAMSTLITDSYEAPNHAFKFTDETPENGDLALSVAVSWHSGEGDEKNGTRLIYDIDSNTYLRYYRTKSGDEPWIDRDTQIQPAFANVIVQFTHTEYKGNDAPVTQVLGRSGGKYTSAEGNADFFMCGQHISGYWKREGKESRTVYYGPDGEEISLQRGKTLILIFPDDKELGSSISYSDSLSY